MASYQAIATELEAVKDRLNFVMETIRLAQRSPIVGAQPQVVSLNDLYHASRQAGLTIDADPIETAPTEEPTNG